MPTSAVPYQVGLTPTSYWTLQQCGWPGSVGQATLLLAAVSTPASA
ncbi:hypothetical protein [Streptomyces sp. enrichment culture]